jgi:Cu/Ag efflux protein CusF
MKHSAISIAIAIALLATGSPLLVAAQTTPTPGTASAMPLAASPAAPMVEGEVRKVDKDTRKITLKHGDMPSLEMPAMTMVFQVKDPAMIDTVKAGDKVKFTAQKVGGAFVITEIQVVK